MHSKWFHALIITSVAVGASFIAPAKSHAIWDLFGHHGHHGAAAQPATVYQPVVANNCCNPCQQQVSYAPQTSYRAVYTNQPVTSYRPVSTTDPCTGCPVTSYQPVTQMVQRVQYVPTTVYRPVVSGGAAAPTTSYYAPTNTTNNFAPFGGLFSGLTSWMTPNNNAPVTAGYAPTTAYYPPTTTNYAPMTANYAPTTTNYAPAATGQPGCGGCGAAVYSPEAQYPAPIAAPETPAPSLQSRVDLGGSVLVESQPVEREIPAAEAERTLHASETPQNLSSPSALPGQTQGSLERDNGAVPARQPQIPQLYDPKDRTTQRTASSLVLPASLNEVRSTPVSNRALQDAQGWRPSR